MKSHPPSPYCGCLPCSIERQRLAAAVAEHGEELTSPKPFDGVREQIARTTAPDYDPTCILCHTGEEPGHEH